MIHVSLSLFEKAEALDAFKIYKVELERQTEMKIKIVRSNRGGEYYGSLQVSGQLPGPFVMFFKNKAT